MTKSTSFDLEDAKALLKQLQQFNEILQQEWSKVSSQWGNLQATWHDDQFDEFDPLFEKLSATYDNALLECEDYIGFLKIKIQIAEQQGFNLLKALEKPIAIDPEKSPAVQQYNSMPGIARSMSAEDLLNEAYSQEREREAKRSKKEAEVSTNAASLPTTCAPPTSAHSVTEFSNSLNYPIRYGSFEVGESSRIEATTSDGTYTDCFINFEVSGVGRVRIQDTVIPPNYRRKGVGTKLLEALESNLPDGTVLYFSENQEPDFWKKMGFKIITNNGISEYFKIVSHPANTK